MKVLVASIVTVVIAAGLARAGKSQQQSDVLKFQRRQYEGFFISKKPNFCPDKSVCPDDQTCCETSGDTSYQCCPYKDGVCCAGNGHCCPHGYKCVVIEGSTTCKENSLTTRRKRATNFPCPDKSECPAGHTCCSNQKGGYTCCPHPMATCCADNVHCCPNGYTCDSGSGNCTLDDPIQPATMKLRLLSPLPKVADVICPDQSKCPDETSCCPVSGGKYGCCPYIEAVCCSNSKTCCPRGYKCDGTSEKCLKPKGLFSIPAAVKLPSFPVGDQLNRICPDHRECPEWSTCCLGPNDHYACCPLKEATCCSDKKHCCPHGYKCDSTGACYQGGVRIKALAKLPSKDPLSDVICADGSICPGVSTCCKAHGDGFGCCKFENGVCCLDGLHCCPANYTCDSATASCRKEGPQLLPKKTRLKTISHDVPCPDGSRCPPGNKCCWDAGTNSYGCCQFERGNCCMNGRCCDEGYRCVDGGLCDPLDGITRFLQRLQTVKQNPLS